ncbi:MAG: hypothetical protein IKC31_00925 [Clostridia bacterium]|nr:hypothetical protein [Clostridia bacterium]
MSVRPRLPAPKALADASAFFFFLYLDEAFSIAMMRADAIITFKVEYPLLFFLLFFRFCGMMKLVMTMKDNNVGATSGRPQRKKNRLEHYDYSSCGAYFLTICTVDRRNYFWEKVGEMIDCPEDVKLSRYGDIVNEAIQKISSVYPALLVENYVIMPNHVHLLLRTCVDECGRPLVAPTMSRVVNQLKGYVSKRIGSTIWQKSFHDHIIRNIKDYEEHIKYIYENPMRWSYDELYSEE